MPTGRIVDCHVHVFDPARFPYAPDAHYSPSGQELGTPARLAGVLDAHGVDHALLVGPNSGYGEDNRLLLDSLVAGDGRYRGMAVVHNDISRAELARMQAVGVVGVTLNAALLGVGHYAEAGALLGHLEALDMIADVQVVDDQLLAMAPLLERAGVRVHVDHCGRPDPGAGPAAPGFRELLRWGRSGRAVVKLSGCVKVSREPYPHRDLRPFVDALLVRSGPSTAPGDRTGRSCGCPSASTTGRCSPCSPSRCPIPATGGGSCGTRRAASSASRPATRVCRRTGTGAGRHALAGPGGRSFVHGEPAADERLRRVAAAGGCAGGPRGGPDRRRGVDEAGAGADGADPDRPHPPRPQPGRGLRLHELRLAGSRAGTPAPGRVLRERRQGRRRGGHDRPGDAGVLRRAQHRRARRALRVLARPAGPHHPPDGQAAGRHALRADRLGRRLSR